MSSPPHDAPPPPSFDVSRVLVWAIVAAIVVAAVAAALLLPQRGDTSQPQPPAGGSVSFDENADAPAPPTTGLFERAIGVMPDLPATERSGLPLRTSELHGRYLVVDFVFSSCAGTCPRLQIAMKELQDATADERDLRLVSLSVDPQRDTPELLRGWADALGADRARWLFLLMSDADVRTFMRDGLMVPTNDDLILHSGLFVLVDPNGAVRGRYSPLEHDNWLAVLRADLAKLRAEAPESRGEVVPPR